MLKYLSHNIEILEERQMRRAIKIILMVIIISFIGFIQIQINITRFTNHLDVHLTLRADLPIFIDGDNQLNNSADSGFGNETHPYIIENKVIDGDPECIRIQNTSAHFIVRNCTFNFSNTGANGIHFQNVTNGKITNCTISTNTGSGIYLVSSTKNVITSNSINLNNVHGIYLGSSSNENIITNNTVINNLASGIHLSNSHNNTLLNNTANDNDNGFYLQQATNNTLTDNNANINTDYGIYLATDSNNNTLIKNTVSNNTANGIYLYSYCNNNTLTNNTANFNTGVLFEGNGIIIEDHCDNNTLTNNTVKFNQMMGIQLIGWCMNNTLKNNTAMFNLIGFILRGSSENNDFIHNRIISNRADGLWVEINNNYFYRNLIWLNAFIQIQDIGSGNIWIENLDNAYGDFDTDGLENAAELPWGASPWHNDTDGDLIPDGYETTNSMDPVNGTDATDDFEPDGLTNLEEYSIGTDPNDPDTDADELDDGTEVNSLGTDPLDLDSDNDFMPDGWEVQNSLDPLNDEDAIKDEDLDGLLNYLEYAYTTDVNNSDTDGDGYSDGTEISAGTSPLNPNDYPGKVTPNPQAFTSFLLLVGIIIVAAIAVVSLGINAYLVLRTKAIKSEVDKMPKVPPKQGKGSLVQGKESLEKTL